jgi:cell division protein FtsQ
VRQGSHIGLVDANGVLLDMPMDAKSREHYSFPVVTGISGNDPVSTRAARMTIFERFTSELDGSGEKISQELSEVDLSNPEDVQALIPDHSTEILVHFGEDNFLERYQRFKEHLPEWRTLYPKLSSVDMRYEQQVVLQMPPGSAGQATPPSNAAMSTPAGDANASKTPSPARSEQTSELKPDVKPSDKPAAKAPSADGIHSAVTKSAAKPAHVTAQSEVAFAAPVKKSAPKAPKSKPHAAASKHPPVATKHPAGTTQHHPTQVAHP